MYLLEVCTARDSWLFLFGQDHSFHYSRFYSQAFREAIPRVEKLAAAAKPRVADASTLRELASAWSSMSATYDIDSKQQDNVLFPALEAFFPGTVSQKRHPVMLVDSCASKLFYITLRPFLSY